MNRSFVLACISTFVVSAAHAETTDRMADCGKVADGWKAAYNAKDAGALAGLYNAKSGTYSNSFWTATGREALTESFKQELGGGSTMTSIKCDTSSFKDGLGVSTGTWSATAKGPDGKDAQIGGHWMTTTEFKGGKYLILTHVGNMQLPPPGGPK